MHLRKLYEIKINLILVFTLSCGASKGFVKALKTFSFRPGPGQEGLARSPVTFKKNMDIFQ